MLSAPALPVRSVFVVLMSFAFRFEQCSQAQKLICCQNAPYRFLIRSVKGQHLPLLCNDLIAQEA